MIVSIDGLNITVQIFKISHCAWSAVYSFPASSFNSQSPTVFAVAKVNANPLTFDVVLSRITDKHVALQVSKDLAAGGKLSYSDFSFERLLSPKDGLYYWSLVDRSSLYKGFPSSDLHSVICSTLDEVLKVEAIEVIEGTSDEKLHSENPQRQGDHGVVLASFERVSVPSNSD